MNAELNDARHAHELQLAELCASLSPWQAKFSEIDDIRSLLADFRARVERFEGDEQRLNIGIMGQVKAGKSSFLNALLFNGQPILPEAATPKTATLTRISYGEQPALEVEYCTQEEWDGVIALAARDGGHPEAKAARELAAMAAPLGDEVRVRLARGHDRLDVAQVSDLLGMLNDYAGGDGKYTALVKSVHICLPHEELRGFDVVDTPGLNDPVYSRTQKTKEYMARCDVVFFMSRCSQFLDSVDMDLLSRQLPGKGIKRMILVASQFDAAILDDGYNRRSLAETEANLATRLGRRAADTMGKLAASREEAGAHETAGLLRSLQKPTFSSTFAHAYVSRPAHQWGGTMRHVHKELAEMAADSWNGYAFTDADWARIANFQALQDEYHAARADKTALLVAQVRGLIPDSKRELAGRLADLDKAVESRIAQLRGGDVNQLQEKQRRFEQRIGDIDAAAAMVVDAALVRARSASADALAQLKADMSRHAELRTRTGTAVELVPRTYSTSVWYKPWTWGDTRTVMETRTRSYQYLAAADAIEKIMGYGTDSAAHLQDEFARIVHLGDLKMSLRKAFLNVLDTGDTGFDPVEFNRVLDRSLRRLRIPALCIDLGDAAGVVSRNFQGEVQGANEMDNLKRATGQALRDVLAQLAEAFETAVGRLCAGLATSRASASADLASGLREELEQVRSAFADKESELRDYQAILAIARSGIA